MNLAVALLLLLVGTVVGSFLNVCIHRMPRGESVVRPRSRCPACGSPVAALDNVPVLSFLLLRGRCRSCRGPISWRYPVVEAITALLFAGTWLWFGADPRAAVFLPFTAICVALFVIDAEHQLLPDLLTLPGIALGLLLSIWNPLVEPRGSLLGALLGAAIPTALIGLYWVVRRRQGMGWGDVKMLAMIGAFLGWDLTLLSIVASSGLGIAWWGGLQIAGRGAGLRAVLPFGAFLAPGAIACLWFGEPVLAWYRSLLAGTIALGPTILP